jgi:TonB family protein
MRGLRIEKSWLGQRTLLIKAAMWIVLVGLALPGMAEERSIKSKTAPVYPEIAKRMKIAGTVKIEASVTADGKVSDVKTLSGNHMLAPAAEEAVRKWEFSSGDSDSTVDVDVNFNLTQ